jgi:hypothetical protein
VPEAPAASRAGSTTAGKLGLAPGQIVALLNAPQGYTDKLQPLPKGVVLQRQMGEGCSLVVWFVRTKRELQDSFGLRAGRLSGARLWVLWPKKSAGLSGDLTEAAIRDLGAASGLLAEKSASIDPEWSGLLFAPAPRE